MTLRQHDSWIWIRKAITIRHKVAMDSSLEGLSYIFRKNNNFLLTKMAEKSIVFLNRNNIRRAE